MNALIGMNGLGVVSIVIGGAVLSFSVLMAFGAGLGMLLNGQIRREQEQRESEELAEALRRMTYQPKPPPRPIAHRMASETDAPEAPKKRPYDDQKQGAFLPGRRMIEIDTDTMTPAEIARVIEESVEAMTVKL